MPAVAAAAGVSVETVASGAGEEFSRPEQAIQPSGPIANSLDGRLTGVSRAVDAIATELARAVDAPLDGRVGNPR